VEDTILGRWIWVSFPDSLLGIGGFGGLFSILIFLAIANFLVQAFRRVGSGEIDEVGYSSNPPVSVTRLQVGLAEGRSLQTELNRIAETADTNSPEGRTEVLQEASLALLRHPNTAYMLVPHSKLA